MPEVEWRDVTPEALISELENRLRQWRENKYAFQVGLKDLDFELHEEKVRSLGITMPFQSVDEAEQALRSRVIIPTAFVEDDATEHHVAVFVPEPVGYSGFMGCVTHSLALTDRGLFEVGRYPTLDLREGGRYWGWFLHRRLATVEQVAAWKDEHNLSPEQIVERFAETMAGG